MNTLRILERQTKEEIMIVEHIGDMNSMDYYD